VRQEVKEDYKEVMVVSASGSVPVGIPRMPCRICLSPCFSQVEGRLVYWPTNSYQSLAEGHTQEC
jgi:hypothetical protein